MDWLLREMADRLGVAPPRAGEAIVPQIRFEQPWSQGLLLVIVVASATVIIWLYRREGRASLSYKMGLAAIRIALVLLALFMLSEAVLSVERTGLPYFVIMVDDSASQSVVDQYADPKAREALGALAKESGQAEASRLAIAQGWLERNKAEVLRELQKQHKVKLYLLSTSARPLAEVDRPEDIEQAIERLKKVGATGTQSRLGTGVRQVLTELRGVAPTAILMLTDGQTTEGEGLAKAAEFASRKGVPLFTIGLGDSEPARDLELTDLLVDDVVFVDDQVRFQAKLLSRGFAGQELTIRLKQRIGDSADSNATKELESIRVTAPPDGQPKRIEVSHRPKDTGDITYILEIEPKERELQKENNRIERTILVSKEKLKVLLVDGEPRYEYRYLKNFLERQTETIDLNVLLQSADREYAEQDHSALPTFPASKDDLFAYDVVIMGDVDPSFLSTSQMNNLAEFVITKGGGIMFVSGEAFNPLSYKHTPLETLLPIDLGDARNPTLSGISIEAFRPVLTAEGRVSPIFRFGDDEATSAQIWQNLPQLYWFIEAPRKKPAAFVLAEHETLTGSDGKLPIFVYHFVGAGKSMFNAVDDTWRWRLRVGDRFFGRFWIQSIRFLARSKLLGRKQAEVTTDRRRYQRGQPVQIQVRFPNPGLAPTRGELFVQYERKGQGPRKLALKPSPNARNVFEGALPQTQEGDYEIRLLPPPVLETGMPSASFRVEPPASEFEHVPMNEPELVRAASLSGGKFYTPIATAALLSDLPKPQKVPLDTDPPIPIWNTWLVLVVFLVLLTTEWVLRKRKQML